MTILHSIRIATSGLAVAVLLACGGGGGTDNGPKLIAQQTTVVSVTGGTVQLPDESAKATVVAGVAIVPTEVTLSAYDGTAPFPGIRGALGNRTLQITADPATLKPDGTIRVEMPSGKTGDIPESHYTWCYYQDPSGAEYPVEATIDPVTKIVSANVPVSSLNRSASLGRETSKKYGVYVLNYNEGVPEEDRAAASFYKFGRDNPSTTPSEAPALGSSEFDALWLKDDPNNPAYDWSNKRIAVLTHGIKNDIGNLTQQAYFLLKLRNAKGLPVYDHIYGLNYNWKAHIKESGTLAAGLLDKFHRSGARVDLYGHSMGGLVWRSAIELVLPSGQSVGVERLFTYGTPHTGFPSKINGYLQRWVLPRLAPGVQDLVSTSQFITELGGSTAGGGVVYTCLAGQNADYFGGNWHGVEYNVGAEIKERVYNNAACDGVVSLFSAQPTSLKGNGRIVRFPSPYYLNHSDIRGIYEFGMMNLTIGREDYVRFVREAGLIEVGIQ